MNMSFSKLRLQHTSHRWLAAFRGEAYSLAGHALRGRVGQEQQHLDCCWHILPHERLAIYGLNMGIEARLKASMQYLTAASSEEW